MKKRNPSGLTKIEIPEDLANELKRRFKPIVRRALQARDLDGIKDALLWVYLQGVLDGAEVQRRTNAL